jgi:PKD repeat protein
VSVMLNWGAAGNVIAYNYSTNLYHQDYLAWMINDFCFHGAHPSFNLFEGNMGIQFRPDTIWGSSSHSTLLRNYFAGSDFYAPPINARGAIQWQNGYWESANNFAVSIDYLSPSNNLVGNVAGSAWLVSDGAAYLKLPGGSGSACFQFGFNSDTAAGVNTLAFDSAIFHGNYDLVTRSQHWAANVVDRNIPSSYYLAGKPAWFGALPWPPVDPASAGSLSITNLPAGYRFVFGVSPAAGPINQAPTALASANVTSGPAPLAVAFSSNGSRDPEGAALTYSWTFGDGGSSAVASPSHTYQSDGSYVATLVVSDGTNTTTSNPINIRVGNQPPIVAVSATPTSGFAPLPVTFSTVGTTDPESAPLTYAWNFGDGGTSAAANPSHTFSAVGSFRVALTVSDGTKSTVTNLTISVADAAASLVAAYGFEEGSGTTVADGSGNGNTGTIQGATWAAGRFGNALSFDGTSSAVVVRDSAALDFTTGLTLEAWVKPTSVSGWRPVIFKDPLMYVLQAATGSASPTAPSIGGTFAGNNLVATAALPLNTWSHLAGTYDGVTLRLYLNGVQVVSRAQSGLIQTSNGDLNIGASLSDPGFFAGLIDEIRIYNRSLSAVEIQSDMNNPVAGARPNTPQGFKFADTQ